MQSYACIIMYMQAYVYAGVYICKRRFVYEGIHRRMYEQTYGYAVVYLYLDV